jgi:hypothetical protein
MASLLDAATADFLETGCGLLVGTTTTDGEPVATRGWGCTVLEQTPTTVRLRVLLSLDDPRGIEHVRPGDAVAVTATSVLTLHSVQVKGTVQAIEPGDTADAERMAAYCAAFFGDIVATDAPPPELPERLRPTGVLAWVVEAGEAFDQTPGPSAGTPIPAATP